MQLRLSSRIFLLSLPTSLFVIVQFDNHSSHKSPVDHIVILYVLHRSEDQHNVLVKSSRVGHLRLTFKPSSPSFAPSLLLEVTRPSVITSTPTNITYSNGQVTITPPSPASNSVWNISGFTDERQDWIITPTSIAENASKFKGYFCAQITTNSSTLDFGINQNGTIYAQALSASGQLLSAYTVFSSPPTHGEEESEIVIDVRIGMSLISESTARSHVSSETPRWKKQQIKFVKHGLKNSEG
ncbi:hypothetical protein JOM56_015261 [Amanita muscaria]